MTAAIRCGTKGCPNEATEKVPDEKLPHVVYDLCASCATGMRALRGVELIDKRNVLDQPLNTTPIRPAATAPVEKTPAEFAFEDALIALEELDHKDVADRLRERWADVLEAAA